MNLRKILVKSDRFFFQLHRLNTRLLRRMHYEWGARTWSNQELRKFSNIFEGSIINVSGWNDSDKEGSSYEQYFQKRTSYTISNIPGARGLSENKRENEIELDLTKPLPENLHGKFDVVFNHTTLEHVFDIQSAINNLCALSKDIVIVVVPFLQMVHFEEGSYGDYWRFTPHCMEKLFEERGFKLIYCSNNDNPVDNVYLFCVATRNPKKWAASFVVASHSQKQPGQCWYELELP